MAVFTSLPVYKSSYDLLIELNKKVSFFSREHKYSLGERIKNEALDLIINIYKANKSKGSNRLGYIDTARKNIEILRLFLRLCKDLKVIGLKAFVFINSKINEVSKQLKGWFNYVNNSIGQSQ